MEFAVGDYTPGSVRRVDRRLLRRRQAEVRGQDKKFVPHIRREEPGKIAEDRARSCIATKLADSDEVVNAIVTASLRISARLW